MPSWKFFCLFSPPFPYFPPFLDPFSETEKYGTRKCCLSKPILCLPSHQSLAPESFPVEWDSNPQGVTDGRACPGRLPAPERRGEEGRDEGFQSGGVLRLEDDPVADPPGRVPAGPRVLGL